MWKKIILSVKLLLGFSRNVTLRINTGSVTHTLFLKWYQWDHLFLQVITLIVVSNQGHVNFLNILAWGVLKIIDLF